uniref:Uncharacterized protein n=1 Tax=Parascaris equorum TaxID=6256 RepID=A0A914RD36_PAREQ
MSRKSGAGFIYKLIKFKKKELSVHFIPECFRMLSDITNLD